METEVFNLDSREIYDLIILDVGLPGQDGLSLCREFRANQVHSAIIMLTMRGAEIDRVLGLELGADDYVQNADTGITLSVSQTGTVLSVIYTSTNTGVNGTINYSNQLSSLIECGL